MEKRVIIVDFNHMAYSYHWSKFRLSCMLIEDGKAVEHDTTIASGTIKNIFRWSKNGKYPTAVCFDRKVTARKEYFQEQFPDMKIGSDNEYKGKRSKMPEDMKVGIADSEYLLRKGGVSCFAAEGYEADDLIFACVQRAKAKYPGWPIDVITNDADLLPLVDDTVSVFIRSKTGTYAESKDLEKAKYVQVTPRNFQSYVESLSDYKGFLIPYNSLLLHKLLRGDKSDNYKRKDISRLFPMTKYNDMISRMLSDDINFEEIFRYGEPVVELRYKDTDKLYEGTLQEALKSPNRANLYQKIKNTEQLDVILEVLKIYTPLSEEMLDHIEKMYWGINLNQIYPNKKGSSRRAFNCLSQGDINPFDEFALNRAVSTFNITLLK